jgi:hypothetical protein
VPRYGKLSVGHSRAGDDAGAGEIGQSPDTTEISLSKTTPRGAVPGGNASLRHGPPAHTHAARTPLRRNVRARWPPLKFRAVCRTFPTLQNVCAPGVFFPLFRLDSSAAVAAFSAPHTTRRRAVAVGRGARAGRTPIPPASYAKRSR